MRRQKILNLFLTVCLFLSPRAILADNANTIIYLQNQTPNHWVTQSLASAGVNNLDISYIDYQSTDLMIVIKNILVLSATGHQDRSVYTDLVNRLNTNFNNGQLGSPELLNDDFWGLIALASIKKTDNSEDIKNFILSHQNQDGGWSWSVSGQSDSNDTAAAIMALLDFGLDKDSTTIVNALNYLRSTQNEDGGFGYDVASQSDGASTAWGVSALNKVTINPSSWNLGANDPLSFLNSLKQTDGSFFWLSTDTQSSTVVTAYALTALSGKYYPVAHVSLLDPEPSSGGHSIRIEGPSSTICLANNLEALNVLELLTKAAQICGFDYQVTDTAYGPYVSSISGINAQGMDGWQYWVDWHSPTVSVENYQLTAHETVLWGYGGFPIYPTKVELDNHQVSSGASVIVSSQYYDGSAWQVWPQANVYIGTQMYQSDNSGQVIVTLSSDGVYPVWAETDSTHLRTSKEYVTIGNGISQTIDLAVNIPANDNGGDEDRIAFTVSQSNINFGDLHVGQAAESMISLTNTGSIPIHLEASVLGDQVFTNFTKINQLTWPDFSTDLDRDGSQALTIGLSLPSNTTSTGSKTGQLIFWASH